MKEFIVKAIKKGTAANVMVACLKSPNIHLEG
jgi:hypothetical protein